MVRKSKRNSVNKLVTQKKRVIKELKKSGMVYRKARKEFGKNDPMRKKKKTKRSTKLKCFSRLNLKNKRYVTCVKRFSETRSKKLRQKRGGTVLPLHYFDNTHHKNYSRHKNKCLHT